MCVYILSSQIHGKPPMVYITDHLSFGLHMAMTYPCHISGSISYSEPLLSKYSSYDNEIAYVHVLGPQGCELHDTLSVSQVFYITKAHVSCSPTVLPPGAPQFIPENSS